MTTTNLLNEKEHTLHRYDYERQNQIAILYNAKTYKKTNFNSFLDNPNIKISFFDHDVLALIECNNIQDVNILYLCLGEWKKSHESIMKMINSMNVDIKFVLIIDNIKDLPLPVLNSFSIRAVLNSITFFNTAHAINDIISNDILIFENHFKVEFQKKLLDQNSKMNQEYDDVRSKYKLKHLESEVLRLLSDGKSYEDIAVEIERSVDSVRYYIKSLYRKLNVNNKGAAIRIYLKE